MFFWIFISIEKEEEGICKRIALEYEFDTVNSFESSLPLIFLLFGDEVVGTNEI